MDYSEKIIRELMISNAEQELFRYKLEKVVKLKKAEIRAAYKSGDRKRSPDETYIDKILTFRR